jgi:hypothetical protein
VDLVWEKKGTKRFDANQKKQKSSNPNPRSTERKGWSGVWILPDSTSRCHHRRRTAWTPSGQDTRPDARPRCRATSLRTRAKGTDVGPFDGGALTHVWTRAPGKGPAAAHLLIFPRPPWPSVPRLWLSMFGEKKGREIRGKKE